MFYLASGSPRRKELLSLIISDFEVLVPVYDEVVDGDEKPLCFVKRMSEGKAQAFYDQFSKKLNKNDIFLTADTIVTKDEVIFGKPESKEHALSVLTSLQDSVHEVITSVTIGKVGDSSVDFETFTTATKVHFRMLTSDEIEDYLKTDEPWDKAGGYGIQGLAGKFVDKIDGSYHNVVGLPISQLAERLQP